jgi:hypothetical protein
MQRKTEFGIITNEIYNGKFIDYYYKSGRIQGEGILKK